MKMKKYCARGWSHRVLQSMLGIVVVAWAAEVGADPAPARSYQVGDHVEVQWPGDDKWYAAKVTSKEDGRYFIVYDQDGNNAWYKPERMRLVKAAPAPQPKAPTPPAKPSRKTAPRTVALKNGAAAGNGKATQDANGTLSADRPILVGPVKQTPVKNGTRPNPELLKKIIRLRKGEKAAEKGYDGAVTIDITALQIGSPRKWKPLEDSGSGTLKTVVYPVKVTYTEKTFYRTRTVVNENWIRILNCYVNAFGEWQVGSEEPVKSPDIKNVPRG